VSVQRAAGASQAETAAADHQLEPHGILFVHQGFIAFLNAELSFVDHIANSSMVTFQSELTQASTSFSITVALNGGLNQSSIFDEQVVGTQTSQNISLTAIGTHSKTQDLVFNHSSFIKLNDCILLSYFLILSIK